MGCAPFSCSPTLLLCPTSPSMSQGGRCQYQIWRYLGPFHYWIRLSHVSDEAMDRTNPRGLHLGVMSSGRMLIDVNPPTLLLVVMKGKQMKVLDLKFRLTINVVLQTLAARRHCAQVCCACGISPWLSWYLQVPGMVPVVSWLIPTQGWYLRYHG
ncbi:Os01g0637050 [Oryza sativa Japonica Group]|uniref:Os01g0637050 protein n=1 Tax=Oryza sativa subsp. japonica TaxID=39947 RepID=A0A0P0V5P7_ORYSJ|nr:Os01g0637050 [Oryza sativa Japonica Group]